MRKRRKAQFLSEQRNKNKTLNSALWFILHLHIITQWCMINIMNI